jgi:antitoxin ParD1/3/4
MNISLTPALEEFVATKVRSGRYTSASEVVREALRLLEEHDAVHTAELTAFNQELAARLAALDAGESVNRQSVHARLRRKSEDRRKQIA